MSAELDFFPKAVPYFRNFVNANLRDIFNDMIEYRIYPSGGYGSFYRDSEIIQLLHNIYHNIDEGFGDLQIPETFPSPNALARAWDNFFNFLKKEDKLFEDIYEKLGSKDQDFPYSTVLLGVDRIRKQVIDVLEYILSLSEVRIYLKNSQDEPDRLEYKINHERLFDVVIVTAIYKEYEQVIKLLERGSIPKFKDPSRTTYFQGEITTIDNKRINVLVACANQMGMTSAASLASKLIYRFTPKVIAMCGIAAGITGQIGDIMVPDIVWDYGSGKNTLETKFFLKLYKRQIEKFVPYRFPITIKQDLVGQLIRISKTENIGQRIYELSEEIQFQNKSNTLKTHIGPFVSGSAVIANDKVLNEIKTQDGKLIGFDMEAFAIAYAASVSDITPQPIAFITKSISDYGDAKKNHEEKDKHQEYAAFTSAQYLYLLLKENSDLFNL